MVDPGCVSDPWRVADPGCGLELEKVGMFRKRKTNYQRFLLPPRNLNPPLLPLAEETLVLVDLMNLKKRGSGWYCVFLLTTNGLLQWMSEKHF